MIHYIDVTIPERIEQSFSHISCDSCGCKIEGHSSSGYEYEFMINEGTISPDGGVGRKISFDFCHQCAREKVLPELLKIAPSVTWELWDW